MLKFEIAMNKEYGMFELSKKAVKRLNELTGKNMEDGYDYLDISMRSDPFLIQVIKELGDLASKNKGDIHIVEICISEFKNYDGIEELDKNYIFENVIW